MSGWKHRASPLTNKYYCFCRHTDNKMNGHNIKEVSKQTRMELQTWTYKRTTKYYVAGKLEKARINRETQRFVIEKENIRWQTDTRKQNNQVDAHK